MAEDSRGFTVIASVIKNTPAEKAGLKAGDIIYKVDSEDVTKLSSAKIAKKIKGQEKTVVNITVIRKGKEQEFKVERADINIPVVHGKMLEDNIRIYTNRVF